MAAADEERRVRGLDRTGTVELYDFDKGVLETLGAKPYADAVPPGYYLDVAGVCGPPGLPGVPVVFALPEDVVKDFKDPMILVRRDDIAAAMDRWQPGGVQYRAAGLGAVPFIAKAPGGASVQGWDRAEMLPQAIPYDIAYTISIRARFRGGQISTGGSPLMARNNANMLLNHVLRTFPPYGKLNVVDSIGDLRGYEAFNEGIANIDQIAEIQDRTIGFAITLRVEAELDLKDPTTVRTATHPLVKTIQPK